MRASFHFWAPAARGASATTQHRTRRAPRRASDAFTKGRRRAHAGQARARRTCTVDELRRFPPPRASAVGSCRCGATACSTPTRRSRRSPSCGEGPFAFLLESAPAGGETWSRYTFLGSAAARRVAAARRRGARTGRRERGWHGARTTDGSARTISNALIARAHAGRRAASSARSGAGAVGFFGYDVVRLIERLPSPPKKAVHVPDALFVFTRRAGDHRQPAVAGARRRGRAGRRRHERRDAARRVRSRAGARSSARSRSCGRRATLPLARPAHRRDAGGGRRRTTTRERVPRRTWSGSASTSSRATPSRCCWHGASRCRTTFRADALYRALRALNPSPYMYHLVLDGVELVGSSPELLVRVSGGRVDGAADRRHAAARRDAGAGRGARRPSSRRREGARRARDARGPRPERRRPRRAIRHASQVTRLMVVETYSHVLHIVSQVEGELRDGLDRRSTRSARPSPPAR